MSAISALEIPAPNVLRAFDRPGPRYTSYPSADRFTPSFGASAYGAALAQRAQILAPVPLSLYVHLPFCDTVCYYCACNKVVTRHHDKVAPYLAALLREAQLVAQQCTHLGAVTQLHLGGGTPTYLSNEQLHQLTHGLTTIFPMAPRGEWGVEVDPRSAPVDKIQTLAQLGFNRISIGVQDFDAQVQRAVNRVQDFALTAATVQAAREAGFGSVNLDLIYGLPLQTRSGFAATLDQVLALDPDRVALYHYAHLPARFKPQRRIAVETLPTPAVKMSIMCDAVARLTQAGYVYIGMDHFAREHDELARAQAQGRLHRNFQGYSTHADCDLLGLGVSAISRVGATYAQNAHTLEAYYDAVAAGALPTWRGVMLDRDDVLRRAVIMSLMCQFVVSKEAISESHLIDFDAYFHAERAALSSFIEAGLVEDDSQWISITPRGRLLVRAVSMVFDRYLHGDQQLERYSKVI